MDVFERLSVKEYDEHRLAYHIVWVKEENETGMECVSKSHERFFHESWLYPMPATHYLYEQLIFEEITPGRYEELKVRATKVVKTLPEHLKDMVLAREQLVLGIWNRAETIVSKRGVGLKIDGEVDELISYVLTQVRYG